MEILNTFFVKSKSSSHSLNYSNSKVLQVKLESVYPVVKVVLELRAVEHQESVFFSFETWKEITQHASEIRRAMRSEDEEIIFINNELKVFTKCMHEQCAVCFLDIRGKRVNIMLKTFSKMMELGPKLNKDYKTQIEAVNETAKMLKKFMDFMLTLIQYPDVRQCNNLKEQLELLSNYSEPNIANSISNLSYMYDTELEDDYDDDYNEYDDDRCDHCGHRYRNRDYF